MNDASREAFEAWLAKHDPRSFCPNAYWEHDYKWKAWQASRKQALEGAKQTNVTCQIYGHVVGACVECNTHIEKAPTNPSQQVAEPPPTGCDNGLSQDYCKGLGQWLANRPGARQQLREMLVDTTGAVMVEYDIGSESTESAIRQKLIDFGWTPPGADQLEDVRAMVPMTDSEVSTALNGIGSSGLLMRIVRAVEAHHGIK